MKSLITIVLLSLFLVSCSHFYKVKPTDKKNIIEVHLNDAKKDPRIGQNVKVFNWVSKSYNISKTHNLRFDNSEPKGWVREKEVQGKIVEIISNDVIKVELEEDFEITRKTFAEY